MDKLKMHSLNKVDENVVKVGRLFPNCLTERINENGEVEKAIDFDVLKQELSSVIVEGNEERYQFTWPDKKKSILLANAPIAKTLRPCREESVNFDNTGNLYIEGDNLEVLKLLQETYLEKIKMIYIDPPYNTGNDFLYTDDFSQDVAEYIENSGQLDEEGNQLVKNFDTNGRFHTDWLNMLYPRIKLAKNLLTPQGVMYISIDEHEIHNLLKIVTEIFGHNNYEVLIWRKNGKQGNTKVINRFKSSHEYIVVAYKDKANTKLGKMKLMPNWKNEYPNPDNDPRGNYKAGNISLMEEKSRKDSQNYYSITTPTGVVYTREWFISKEEFERLDADKVLNSDGKMVGRIYYPNNGNGVPALKIFKSEEQFYYFDSIIDEMGTFTDAHKDLIELFEGDDLFATPKPIKMIKELIRITCDKSDIVLDFFGGSSTTAQAEIELNAEDGGKRKYIIVQIPEKCDEKSVAYEKGYNNICEIGKERIRRASKKIKDNQLITTQTIDDSFRVLKLDSSNMKGVYYNPSEYQSDLFSMLTDNIKEDRTPEDLLFQVMLDLGVLLSSKIEESVIAGKKVFNVADNFLIACFDDNVNEETIKTIAQQKPYYFVMRDSAMASDSVAANFEQIFATYSPSTARKVL